MARKPIVFDRDQLVEVYRPGVSVKAAAKILGCSEEVVSRNLTQHGIPRHNTRRLAVSSESICRAYVLDKLSVLETASRHGISRSVVDRVLQDEGVRKRTPSEQQRITASRRTPEQRRAMAEASHIAKRGKPNPLASRIQGALTREARGAPDNDSEKALSQWLAARGMTVAHQKAIGPYNVDLAAPPVAVEVFGGNWHASGLHLARTPERCKYILDQGWSMIFVWDQSRCPMRAEAADEVVAFYELHSRDEAAVGQYRVIRGDGKLLASGRGQPDYGAFIPSQVRT